MSGLASFAAVAVGVGFLAERTLSLIEESAFRLPRTENALLIVGEGWERVLYLVVLSCSHGNSGGDEGGLDARHGSSEKMGLSLGIGVDDRCGSGVEVRLASAIFCRAMH